MNYYNLFKNQIPFKIGDWVYTLYNYKIIYVKIVDIIVDAYPLFLQGRYEIHDVAIEVTNNDISQIVSKHKLNVFKTKEDLIANSKIICDKYRVMNYEF